MQLRFSAADRASRALFLSLLTDAASPHSGVDRSFFARVFNVANRFARVGGRARDFRPFFFIQRVLLCVFPFQSILVTCFKYGQRLTPEQDLRHQRYPVLGIPCLFCRCLMGVV